MDASINLTLLWRSTCAGDNKAYSVLHSLLYRGLYTYTKNIVKDGDISDDLLQDMFVKVWQSKSRIGEINNVKAYFYCCTRSIVMTHLRKEKLHQSRILDMIDPDIEFSAEDIITTGENTSFLKLAVQKALNKLPKRQREIIYLRFYEGHSYDEIVQITGIKYQSVVNHTYRAIQLLKAQCQATDFALA